MTFMARINDQRLFFCLIFLVGIAGLVTVLWPESWRRHEAIATRNEAAVGPASARDSESFATSSSMANEPASAPTPPLATMSAVEIEKLALLDEILASKNDGDLRLDTEFRSLSPAMKSALRERYEELPNEDRSGRGTIVFLLGRDLSSPGDIEFLKGVLNEPPCLSLADCSRRPLPDEVDEHAAQAGGITLIYPQLVAIRSFENRVQNRQSAEPLAREIENALATAESSESAVIARSARELRSRLVQ